MKTAYELAMERLNREAPARELTPAQRAGLNELESKCRAKIAEREIFLQGQLDQVRAQGDFEALRQIEQQLSSERKALLADLEAQKEKIRQQP